MDAVTFALLDTVNYITTNWIGLAMFWIPMIALWILDEMGRKDYTSKSDVAKEYGLDLPAYIWRSICRTAIREGAQWQQCKKYNLDNGFAKMVDMATIEELQAFVDAMYERHPEWQH